MPPRKDDTSVYIGRRPTHNYVLNALMILNENKEAVIKARGKAISHAVDVVELLRNKFMHGVEIKHIEIGTEHLSGRDGKESNVSTIEITLAPSQ